MLVARWLATPIEKYIGMPTGPKIATSQKKKKVVKKKKKAKS